MLEKFQTNCRNNRNISIVTSIFLYNDNIFLTYEKFFPNDISSHYFNFVIVCAQKMEIDCPKNGCSQILVPSAPTPPPQTCTPMTAMIHGISIPITPMHNSNANKPYL
jgi:hypothetical protein